ncbi:MAG TPA: DUF3784 domain-containing protein [Bacillota bacterium]|nr:DUF3784 domain-containing protein [Bacillota bacterium]
MTGPQVAPMVAIAIILAVTGMASFIFGHLIGDKRRFTLINGYTDEKMLEPDRFARWMRVCYYIMGLVLLASAALIVLTRAVVAVVLVSTIIVAGILIVMTVGARRYYRI